MVSLFVRNVDTGLHARLKARALKHHRSIEEEAEELLRAALARAEQSSGRNVADVARELLGPEHGVDLDIPARGSAPSRPPPDFSDLD